MKKSSSAPLVTILGPTASGKTKLAVSLAENFEGEIISADSRQVYTGMDIGTGKDLDEYKTVKYHLIDIINPTEEYNLYRFSTDFIRAFNNISQHKKLPFLVGGTGMYLDAVLNRYNLTIAKNDEKSRELLEKKPERELVEILKSFNRNLHNTTDLNSKDRLIQAIEIERSKQSLSETINWPCMDNLVIGIQVDRETIKKRITLRLKQRLNEGMIEEVQQLHNCGVNWETLHNFGLEYRFIAQYLRNELSYNDMYQKLNSAIHYFAKQQSKWFRNIQKKGIDIHWITYGDQLQSRAEEIIKQGLDSL